MLFKETTNKQMPTIFLLHGGGLSTWSLKEVVNQLETDFHIVTPIIDGHGENADEEFTSIYECAKKVIAYIDKEYNGKIYAIGGLSIGAQIATEVLSLRMDIAEYAILESALVYPMKATAAVTVPAFRLFYGLIQKRWFAKMQAKTLFVPDNQFEEYYEDSTKITKQSLINMTKSNASYYLRKEISNTDAKVWIIVGERELKIMKKSAMKLHKAIQGSKLYVAPSMKHGEFSLSHPFEYVKQLKDFIML